MVLAVLLLAAPVWATVDVNCTAVNPGNTYEVQVVYSVATPDTNNVRAFGIRIDVNNGAEISSIDVNDKDYYIFPGTIDINDTTGEVDANGTAVAEGGIGQNYMILEMGSLYADDDPVHKTAPASSGTICSFFVSKECVVSLSRDTERGGVVMEDGSDYASLSGCSVAYAHCMPTSHPDWAQYDSVGRPDCWCTSVNPRQCHGDADGQAEGFFSQWVSNLDLNILMAAWNKPYANIAGLTENGTLLICADFDHVGEGFFANRVASGDLNIMMANWQINGKPDPNCP